MSDKMKINELREFFRDKPFTNDELYSFYSHNESDLKKTTFRWRIYNLKNQGVIYSPKRGLYVTVSTISSILSSDFFTPFS